MKFKHHQPPKRSESKGQWSSHISLEGNDAHSSREAFSALHLQRAVKLWHYEVKLSYLRGARPTEGLSSWYFLLPVTDRVCQVVKLAKINPAKQSDAFPVLRLGIIMHKQIRGCSPYFAVYAGISAWPALSNLHSHSCRSGYFDTMSCIHTLPRRDLDFVQGAPTCPHLELPDSASCDSGMLQVHTCDIPWHSPKSSCKSGVKLEQTSKLSPERRNGWSLSVVLCIHLTGPVTSTVGPCRVSVHGSS